MADEHRWRELAARLREVALPRVHDQPRRSEPQPLIGKYTLTAAAPSAWRAGLAPGLGKTTLIDELRTTQAAATASAALGPPAEVPYRKEMERRFGASFGDVKAYLGRQQELAQLGAEALAAADTVAFASDAPPKSTVAHELAHVLQYRKHGAGSRPGPGARDGAAEREADRVAERFSEKGAPPLRVEQQPDGDFSLLPLSGMIGDKLGGALPGGNVTWWLARVGLTGLAWWTGSKPKDAQTKTPTAEELEALDQSRQQNAAAAAESDTPAVNQNGESSYLQQAQNFVDGVKQKVLGIQVHFPSAGVVPGVYFKFDDLALVNQGNWKRLAPVFKLVSSFLILPMPDSKWGGRAELTWAPFTTPSIDFAVDFQSASGSVVVKNMRPDHGDAGGLTLESAEFRFPLPAVFGDESKLDVKATKLSVGSRFDFATLAGSVDNLKIGDVLTMKSLTATATPAPGGGHGVKIAVESATLKLLAQELGIKHVELEWRGSQGGWHLLVSGISHNGKELKGVNGTDPASFSLDQRAQGSRFAVEKGLSLEISLEPLARGDMRLKLDPFSIGRNAQGLHIDLSNIEGSLPPELKVGSVLTLTEGKIHGGNNQLVRASVDARLDLLGLTATAKGARVQYDLAQKKLFAAIDSIRCAEVGAGGAPPLEITGLHYVDGVLSARRVVVRLKHRDLAGVRFEYPPPKPGQVAPEVTTFTIENAQIRDGGAITGTATPAVQSDPAPAQAAAAVEHDDSEEFFDASENFDDGPQWFDAEEPSAELQAAAEREPQRLDPLALDAENLPKLVVGDNNLVLALDLPRDGRNQALTESSLAEVRATGTFQLGTWSAGVGGSAVFDLATRTFKRAKLSFSSQGEGAKFQADGLTYGDGILSVDHAQVDAAGLLHRVLPKDIGEIKQLLLTLHHFQLNLATRELTLGAIDLSAGAIHLFPHDGTHLLNLRAIHGSLKSPTPTSVAAPAQGGAILGAAAEWAAGLEFTQFELKHRGVDLKASSGSIELNQTGLVKGEISGLAAEVGGGALAAGATKLLFDPNGFQLLGAHFTLSNENRHAAPFMADASKLSLPDWISPVSAQFKVRAFADVFYESQRFRLEKPDFKLRGAGLTVFGQGGFFDLDEKKLALNVSKKGEFSPHVQIPLYYGFGVEFGAHLGYGLELRAAGGLSEVPDVGFRFSSELDLTGRFHGSLFGGFFGGVPHLVTVSGGLYAGVNFNPQVKLAAEGVLRLPNATNPCPSSVMMMTFKLGDANNPALPARITAEAGVYVRVKLGAKQKTIRKPLAKMDLATLSAFGALMMQLPAPAGQDAFAKYPEHPFPLYELKVADELRQMFSRRSLEEEVERQEEKLRERVVVPQIANQYRKDDNVDRAAVKKDLKETVARSEKALERAEESHEEALEQHAQLFYAKTVAEEIAARISKAKAPRPLEKLKSAKRSVREKFEIKARAAVDVFNAELQAISQKLSKVTDVETWRASAAAEIKLLIANKSTQLATAKQTLDDRYKQMQRWSKQLEDDQYRQAWGKEIVNSVTKSDEATSKQDVKDEKKLLEQLESDEEALNKLKQEALRERWEQEEKAEDRQATMHENVRSMKSILQHTEEDFEKQDQLRMASAPLPTGPGSAATMSPLGPPPSTTVKPPAAGDSLDPFASPVVPPTAMLPPAAKAARIRQELSTLRQQIDALAPTPAPAEDEEEKDVATSVLDLLPVDQRIEMLSFQVRFWSDRMKEAQQSIETERKQATSLLQERHQRLLDDSVAILKTAAQHHRDTALKILRHFAKRRQEQRDELKKREADLAVANKSLEVADKEPKNAKAVQLKVHEAKRQAELYRALEAAATERHRSVAEVLGLETDAEPKAGTR